MLYISTPTKHLDTKQLLRQSSSYKMFPALLCLYK